MEGSRNMFWSLSPIENFIYWGGQRGLSRKEAEHNGLQLLKKFGLLDKKRYDDYQFKSRDATNSRDLLRNDCAAKITDIR